MADEEDMEKTSASLILILGLAFVLVVAIVGGALLAPDAIPVFNPAVNNTAENNTFENVIDYGTVLENTFINASGELVIDWQNATHGDNILGGLDGD